MSYTREKGRRAEHHVRDELRKIYPRERRNDVQRTMLSGGGYIKGDITDRVDDRFCYEVKNQEGTSIKTWWQQTLAQTRAHEMPVMVFTKNHHPFYYVMFLEDWDTLVDGAKYSDIITYKMFPTSAGIYKKMAALVGFEVMSFPCMSRDLVCVSEKLYWEVRDWHNKHGSYLSERI